MDQGPLADTWNGSFVDARDESLAAIEIGIQSLILLIAVISNGLVLGALCRQRRLRPASRIYLFMTHLSIADLLVATLSLFPQLIWDITFRFQANDSVCRLVKYLQVMVLYLSTYILVMMAVDRCRAVCWTLTSDWTSLRLARWMIGFAWALSFVAAFPQLVIFRKMEIKPGVHDCWAHFEQPWGQRVYVMWFVCSIFLFPLIVITFSYSFICWRLWTYDQITNDVIALQPLHGVSGSSQRKRPITEAKVKSVKLTLLVVICFFICWAPFCVTQLIVTFNPPAAALGPVEVIFLLLASLNSCTNPWIYVAFSGSLLHQLRLCFGLRPPREGITGPASLDDEGNNHQPPPQQPSNKLPSTKSEMV